MDISELMVGSGIANRELNMVNNIVGRGNVAANDTPNFEDLLKTAASESPHSPVIDKKSKLYEQCMELEIFMVKTLISSMRNTVQKSGLIEQGFAGKMYEDMLYDEYARTFTENANFGMADLAYLELTGQRGKIINR